MSLNVFLARRWWHWSVILWSRTGTRRTWWSVKSAVEWSSGRWFPVTSALLRPLCLPSSSAQKWAVRQRHPSKCGLHPSWVGSWLRLEPWIGECKPGAERTAEWGGRLRSETHLCSVRLDLKTRTLEFFRYFCLIDSWRRISMSIYRGSKRGWSSGPYGSSPRSLSILISASP